MTLIDNFIKTNVPESKKEFSQIQPAINYNEIIELACDRKSLLNKLSVTDEKSRNFACKFSIWVT